MTESVTNKTATVLWALGFRPFYLFAVIFALLAVPMWIASYTGLWQWGGYLQGVSWHGHEMVFGFAPAVICGFLLTAVRNWTGQPTLSGAWLALLATLWVAARLSAVTGPGFLAAALDSAFLPMLAVAIAIPIRRSRNVRNYKILVVLGGLSVANIVYHLANMNLLPAGFSRLAITVALDIITILMAIVGGRVIPAFTANAAPLAKPRHIKSIEVMAIGALVLVLAADIVGYWHSMAWSAWAILLALAAVAHVIRLSLWEPQRTLGNPLLLMLPAAYAWIPISLALRALAQMSVLNPTAALHALTIGAISTLMLAMMARSALGHTGRNLSAGWVEISAFLLLQAAAVTRVTATLIPAIYYRDAVIASGVLWALAFGIFLLRYGAILTRPRIDGRPG